MSNHYIIHLRVIGQLNLESSQLIMKKTGIRVKEKSHVFFYKDTNSILSGPHSYNLI